MRRRLNSKRKVKEYFMGSLLQMSETSGTACSVRPNKKIPVFRVTRPYLNLLVKPRIVFRLSGKKYNFMHFERRNALQNA